MDLSFTAEQETFRERARSWLADNLPPERLPSVGTREGFEAHRGWERALFEAGYAGLHWPRDVGGQGADVVTQAIFEEEYFLASAPERITVVGQKLMGPTLLAYGTEDQKRRWLPGILSAEHVWSQGFSEPDAGSDLAGLRTRAELDGDRWVVNGQKIWTSYGAFADWIFALVRTDPAASRHAGITFLAIDMSTPGIEARPIVQLDGHAGFAEVFFTDVRVPADQVIGAVNDGWNVAMTTLAFERDAPAKPAARYLRDVDELATIARAHTDMDSRVLDVLGGLYARAFAYRAHTMRTLSRLAQGETLGADASATKVLWSELERDIYEAGVDLLGHTSPVLASVEGVSDAREWHSRYWFARAATIYAGTSEVQRNVIAERVLGLPKG